MSLYDVAASITLNPRGWVSGLSTAEGKLRTFAGGVRREFSALRNMASSIEGKLASMGAGFTIANEIVRSARMDQELTRIAQTANDGAQSLQQMRGAAKDLRGEIFRLSKETGSSIEDTTKGLETLIQTGLTVVQAKGSLGAVTRANAVSGANTGILAKSLAVASSNYGFDLSKDGVAQSILDKALVAGRKGNLEIENLANAMPHFASTAQRGHFSYEQSLAFAEALSQKEMDPRRLSTLVESTMRMFTNERYRSKAEEGTGVKFYDDKGGRRDPFAVLADMQSKYNALQSDQARDQWMFKAFGKADMDTVRGLNMAFQAGTMGQARDYFSAINSSTGQISKDMPEAMNNTISQAGRLKATLIEAADGFAKPINAAMTGAIQKLINPKEQGGMGLSGGQLIGGGLAAMAGMYIGGRVISGVIGRLMGAAAGTAGNVAMGKAMTKSGAADFSVFVVNMPAGGLGGAAGAAGALGAAGGKLGTAARGAAGLGLAAGIGTWIGGKEVERLNSTEKGRKDFLDFGRDLNRIMAFFGNRESQRAIENEKYAQAMQRATDGHGRIEIAVSADPSLRVQTTTRDPMFAGVQSGAIGNTLGRRSSGGARR